MKRLLLASLSILVIFSACSQEKQNELARKKIEYLEGDYNITFAEDAFVKKWQVRGGKVTSRDAYYFFWANCTKANGKKDTCYVQTPIQKSIIEEIK